MFPKAKSKKPTKQSRANHPPSGEATIPDNPNPTTRLPTIIARRAHQETKPKTSNRRSNRAPEAQFPDNPTTRTRQPASLPSLRGEPIKKRSQKPNPDEAIGSPKPNSPITRIPHRRCPTLPLFTSFDVYIICPPHRHAPHSQQSAAKCYLRTIPPNNHQRPITHLSPQPPHPPTPHHPHHSHRPLYPPHPSPRTTTNAP